MENQHKKIEGYRELNQEEIDGMKEIKEVGKKLESIIEKLRSNPDTDKVWVSHGEMQLKQGIMALVRSIVKPTTF